MGYLFLRKHASFVFQGRRVGEMLHLILPAAVSFTEACFQVLFRKLFQTKKVSE